MVGIPVKELRSLQTAGVYALVNYDDASVFVGYSRNVMNAVLNKFHFLNIKASNFPAGLISDYHTDKLKLELLSVVPEDQLRVEASEWIKKFQEQEYTIYNSIDPHVMKCEIVVKQVKISRPPYLQFYPHVELVSGGGKRVVVGVFSNMTLANRWMKKHYPTPEAVKRIVYATNSLSSKHAKRETKHGI